MMRLITIFFLVLFSAQFVLAASSSRQHKVYYKGTDYELNVYKINGRKSGKTMLIVGGIQGDEPGGFLSADLYSDITLDQGNLIVVPRANFKSVIMFDRGPDGDMNRRFSDNKQFLEMDKVVNVLKELMGQSDIFLHLHDGWGYYNDEYINKNRNPKRFGQSVIVDDHRFKCESGNVIDLRSLAKKALAEANLRILDKNYKMEYFNTDTSNNLTRYPAMKKTATYYALKEHCIPAFGIEASKNLPTLEMKVLHHNYVVNAFMEMMEIVPDQPRILISKPVLKSVVLRINGERTVVKGNTTVYVPRDAELIVDEIESNYTRGLSCDVRLSNSVNDYGKPVKITKNTEIVFRKDNLVMGRVAVKTSNNEKSNNWVFIVTVDGKKRSVLNSDTLTLKRGTILTLLKTFSDTSNGNDIIINFKGFVPPNITNNNGDDRGYEILIDGKFMSKYSKSGKGNLFPVIAGETVSEKARFWVKIVD